MKRTMHVCLNGYEAAYARPDSGIRSGSAGLSKREEFAARFMAAMLSNPDWIEGQAKIVAEDAITFADALLLALEQNPPK